MDYEEKKALVKFDAYLLIRRFSGTQLARVTRAVTGKPGHFEARLYSANGKRWTTTRRLIPYDHVVGPGEESWAYKTLKPAGLRSAVRAALPHYGGACSECRHTGWIISDSDNYGLQIERCDICSFYRDDDDARSHALAWMQDVLGL